MKFNKINLLCFLFIIILTATVAQPVYYATKHFLTGFSAGYSEIEELDESVLYYTPVDVAFTAESETLYHPTDTICFGDKESLPVIYTRATVMVPDSNYPSWCLWTEILLNLLVTIGFIMLVIELIKFVSAINKGEYFVRRNVKKLLHFGVLLIAIALLQLLSGIIDDSIFSTLGLEYKGYTLSTYWMLPSTNLLLGLLALMMEQIWEKAIQIKEEQEFTI